MRFNHNSFKPGLWKWFFSAPFLWALLHMALSSDDDTLHAQPLPCTLAGTVWRTVDDFQLAPGQRAEAWGVRVTPLGVVYVAGFAEQSTSSPVPFDAHWIVRKSSDGGQTWTTVRDLKLSAASSSLVDGALARNVGQDLSGNVFVVGQVGDGSSTHWIVEKSIDGGASWTTSDDFQLTNTAGTGSGAWAFLPDVGTGYLYVSGTGGDAGNFQHGIVRRSLDGGATWSMVEDQTALGTPSIALGMMRTQPGELAYVGGAFPTWIAKKSPTGDAGTWLLEDIFLPAGFTFTQAVSIFRDAAFNLYAAGLANTSLGVSTGFVRKSTDGGDNWSTIRQFQMVPGSTTFFTGGAWNPAGDVFLSMLASDGSSNHWVIQRTSDGGASWTTEDDYQLVPGAQAVARGIASGLVGNQYPLYAVGLANDGTSAASNHWIVRKINIGCADMVLRGVKKVETAATSGDHTCAIVADPATGQLSSKCWGRNNVGQVGNGSTVVLGVPLPADVVGSGGFKQIDLGTEHTCAVTATDSATCWGSNTWGRLGIGNTVEQHAPANVIGLSSVVRVSAGDRHTCAVMQSFIGTGAACWGRGGPNGALGNSPSSFISTVPVPVVGLEFGLTFSFIEDISAGTEHTCAVVDAGALCWGANGQGQLGDSTTTPSPVPVAVSLPPTVIVRQVSASDFFSCALVNDGLVDGKVFCWGRDAGGQLGNGAPASLLPSPTPVEVVDSVTGLSIVDAVQVSTGTQHACALFGNGDIRCWGLNVNAQLGDQKACGNICPSAVRVMGLQGLKATYVSAGADYTCAVLEDSIAACWGERSNYKLGDGGPFLGNQLLPTAVLRP